MTVETLTFADDGAIPNSSLPVLVYRGALEPDALPAGTGHCNAGSEPGLLVVGAYPDWMRWDLRRGDPAEHDEAVANIARVPLPDTDPVEGREGPLAELWSAADAFAEALLAGDEIGAEIAICEAIDSDGRDLDSRAGAAARGLPGDAFADRAPGDARHTDR